MQRNNIDFKYNEYYDFLDNLQLDFFLPKYNIAIECQGKQHFGLGGWTSNEEKRIKNFESLIKRDEKKLKLCKKNGINLLYYSNLGIEYPYEVIEDENVLLQKILESLNE